MNACTGWSQSITLLPVETIGFKDDPRTLFQSALLSGLVKAGYSVSDEQVIASILAAQKLDATAAVNEEVNRTKIGALAGTQYALALSFLWNGEYALIDLRLTDEALSKIQGGW